MSKEKSASNRSDDFQMINVNSDEDEIFTSDKNLHEIELYNSQACNFHDNLKDSQSARKSMISAESDNIVTETETINDTESKVVPINIKSYQTKTESNYSNLACTSRESSRESYRELSGESVN